VSKIGLCFSFISFIIIFFNLVVLYDCDVYGFSFFWRFLTSVFTFLGYVYYEHNDYKN